MTAFRTTLWSRLKDAASGQPTALNEFAINYRPPLVRFLTFKGLKPADAEDLAQEVFVRLLSRDLLAQGDAQKGRFRNFLIGVTLRVLSEWNRREGALKRGGGAQLVPLELAPPPAVLADFDDIWLGEVVGRALDRVARAHPEQHALLERASSGLLSKAIASELDLPESTVRVRLHRARKSLAEAIKAEVATYCSSDEEYRAELQTFSRFFSESAG